MQVNKAWIMKYSNTNVSESFLSVRNKTKNSSEDKKCKDDSYS